MWRKGSHHQSVNEDDHLVAVCTRIALKLLHSPLLRLNFLRKVFIIFIIITTTTITIIISIIIFILHYHHHILSQHKHVRLICNIMHIWLHSTVHSVYVAGNDILRVICCSCFVPSSIYVFPSLSSPLSARSSTPAIFFFPIYPFLLFLLANATSPGLAVHFFPIKWYCFPNSQISWREPLFQIFGKSWDFVPTIKEGEGWSRIQTFCKNFPKNYVPKFCY